MIMKQSQDENFSLAELMVSVMVMGVILMAVTISAVAMKKESIVNDKAENSDQRGSSYVEDAPSEELEKLAPWESHYEAETGNR